MKKRQRILRKMPDFHKTEAPKRSKAALLLLDVINHFEFPDGDRLLEQALPIASTLARLKKRARNQCIPAIYVNANFGQWRSQASQLIDLLRAQDALSKKFVEQVRLDKDDYFILKPMHFVSTKRPWRYYFGI